MERTDRTAGPPSGTPEFLAQRLGFLLSSAGRIARDRFQRALGETGLQARHMGVLVVLRQEGAIAQGEAARRQGLDKSTLVKVVDDLVEWGLVTRERNAADRRAYQLRLTDAGRDRLVESTRIAEGTDAMFSVLTDDERDHLQSLLTRLLYGERGWLTEGRTAPPSEDAE